MALTTEMKLVELVALKQDVSGVIEYLGKKGNFQLQSKSLAPASHLKPNVESEGEEEKAVIEQKRESEENLTLYQKLKELRLFFGISYSEKDVLDEKKAGDAERAEAARIIAESENLRGQLETASAEEKRISESYKEALSFSNLQVSYSELENLSFLSIRIGKILKENLPLLIKVVKSESMMQKISVFVCGNMYCASCLMIFFFERHMMQSAPGCRSGLPHLGQTLSAFSKVTCITAFSAIKSAPSFMWLINKADASHRAATEYVYRKNTSR